MTAATLLVEREQALDAAMLRLHALEQERQQLMNQVLRLEGAVEALRLVQEPSPAPEVPTISEGAWRGVTGA